VTFRDLISTGKWNPAQTRADSGDTPASPIPTRKQDVQRVGTGEALSLGAAYRAVSLISTAMSQMSVDVYRGSDKIDSPAWVRQPDVAVSFATFIEQSTISLATAGNYYWNVVRDNQGRVQNLSVLNPLDVLIDADMSGNVAGYQYQSKRFRPEQIQQGALLRVPGSVYGLGPIQAAQRDFRGALDTRDFASSRFDGPEPKLGYLSSTQPGTSEQAKTAKQSWIDSMAADNDVAVLFNGFEWHSMLFSPADAQWLESRNFDTTQTARLFGVPAALLDAPVDGSSITYANISQVWAQFVRFGLASYFREIEEGLTWLLPRGTSARFNVEGLLRADTATRYATYAQAVDRWMTKNEIRALEGLDPIDGGDVLATPTPTTPTTGLTND
jgi:HK97 family phage portal protein